MGVIYSNYVVHFGFVIDDVLHYAGDTDYTVIMEARNVLHDQNAQNIFIQTFVSHAMMILINLNYIYSTNPARS